MDVPRRLDAFRWRIALGASAVCGHNSIMNVVELWPSIYLVRNAIRDAGAREA
jgi:hypothetical protein